MTDSLNSSNSSAHLAEAVHTAVAALRPYLNIHFSMRLWDGSIVQLGKDVIPGLLLTINEPGVLPSLLRLPTLDRLIRHYAHGHIDIEGGTIVDIGMPFAVDKTAQRQLRKMSKLAAVKALWPILKAPGIPPDKTRGFGADADGKRRQTADNKRFIGFHYDVGNDFYNLFLDPEMQYSCAYFPEPETDLDAAQAAKIEITCRKLRLKPGDRLLDIGCGWGGLLCHAVMHHGAIGHGVTLSEEQLAFAKAKAERLGLSGRLTFELIDYRNLTGSFDKIVSVGMYEHIGLDNIPAYFNKVRSLLAENGLFLNHAISRRAKRRKFRLIKRPEQRALQKYIFPGGELDDIGHTISEMERAGFEVHDVENWRPHYEKTTRIWCERLTARRAEAEALAGPELYRLWVAYLGGCALTFHRRSARIYQTVAGKSAKGTPPVPLSRADLYR
ncbi:class I SAM-dependent methyltransferase [Roseibium litorale]|uniref:Class I SAM-dependent methyltransferase n=1 Tax=Roseibium litorale TaxID=2803841 RepID=A0ABR9CLP3_9HYPH|nr:class I SAM-dependent methyltransferase [Roseibium litorale]